MTSTKNARAAEALDALTAKLIDAMEGDPGQWTKPWTAGALPANATTGRRYNGTNVLLLSLTAGEREYTSNRWATFKQWKDAGSMVRKGERSSVIVFYKRITVQDESDPDKTKSIPLLRYSSVFAAEQVDGEHAERMRTPAGPGPDPDERAEAWFAAIGAEVRHGGDSAHWTPGSDVITLPPRETFTSAEGFYSTLAHEHAHWTGHATRLDRDRHRTFGDAVYAREELIAELTSVFKMAHLGLAHEPSPDAAAYLKHWAGHLRAKPRELWSVVGDASRALDYLIERAEPSEEAAAA